MIVGGGGKVGATARRGGGMGEGVSKRLWGLRIGAEGRAETGRKFFRRDALFFRGSGVRYTLFTWGLRDQTVR
jgi:hypothetical protein